MHERAPALLKGMKLTARLLLCALALFVILGPLSSLVIWSLAEQWHWPAMLPQRWGTMYWQKAFRGELMTSFVTGLEIAVIVTAVVVVLAVPLAYVLARFRIPFKALILVLFLFPQAFPALPIFANLSTLFYRWDIAGKMSGVVLVQVGAALIYSLWTMVSVFQSVPRVLEDAAYAMGASRLRAFFDVSLPLAVPGIVASGILVFLYSLDEFTGTLLIGSPFVKTLPVQMYLSSMGYEMQIASVTSLIISIPGVLFLILFQRFLKAEYLSSFGRI
ncbi:MAG TPA: spermidine/putrescine ABC transporter permease [Ruminococcaceae bacterium]|jgi:putative spermidine/putrescine transport system permease protein|nr:spermidine/putrescine ABC transporter permease [Oscillospiraceae bacterium]